MVTGHDYTLDTMSLTEIFPDICKSGNIAFDDIWLPEYSVNSLRINKHMYLFSNFILFPAFYAHTCFLSINHIAMISH